MDFSGALMGAANAGEGFIQGKQQAIQNNMMNQMNALQLDNARDQLEQQKQQQQLHQQFLDHLMMQSATTPPNLQSPQQKQDQQRQGQQQTPTLQQLADQQMNQAVYASALGDGPDRDAALNAATKFYDLANKQQTAQDNAQKADLKRQQDGFEFVSSTVGSQPQTQAGFDSAIQAIMSSPMVTPEEKANIQKIYAAGSLHPASIPQLMQQMQMQGLTAAQQAKQRLEVSAQQQKQQQDQRTNELSAQRNKIAQQRLDFEERQAKAGKKAGALPKMPSSDQIGYVNNYIHTEFPGSNLLGESPGKDSSGNPLPASAKPWAGVMSSQIASLANQMVKNNPGLSFELAVPQAIGVLQKTGQIQLSANPDNSGGQQVTGFDTSVGSKNNPIPVTKDMVGDLQVGKWYRGPNGKVIQYTGQ